MRRMVTGASRAVALTAVLLCASAPRGALANTGTPLEITKFSLQTTAATHVIAEGTSKGACQPCRVVNVPYEPAFTQAGGHPWALTTTFAFASEELATHEIVPTRDPRDITVGLPPGLLGNPQALPRCPLAQLQSTENSCPPDTQVGSIRILDFGGKESVFPLFNIVPEAGQSAEFGFETSGKFNFVMTAHLVHTTQGYGVTVTENGVLAAEVLEAELTFWGVPADPSHDQMRGMTCETVSGVLFGSLNCTGGGEAAGATPVAFLSMPTDCSVGPEQATMWADSWQEPVVRDEQGRVVAGQYATASWTMPGVSGCGLVQFLSGTGIELKPETRMADEPTGAEVRLQVPQSETPTGLDAPQLRATKVTLPQGMSVSAGVVDGIQDCEATGPNGIDIPTGLNARGEPLKPGELGEGEEIGLNGEPQLAPGHCPGASTVGTAEAVTPLLGVPVSGHVYLAKPGCGGAGQHECTEQDALDGNLYRLYLELGGKGVLGDTGINFKVPFDVEVNPANGQLTTVVQGIMQAPVSEVKVKLGGGPRASLATPAVCGPALTLGDYTPWSASGVTPEGTFMAGTPDAVVSSEFNVEGCGSPPSFAPGFVAGTVTPNAGRFSSFTMNISRQDREQYVKGIQIHTPAGLLGMLSSVALCGEPQADMGECGPESKIGTTRVASGAGSHPFEIEGDIYLTGPYEGSPFGLSIVVDVVAGPFNLGKKVVRARIAVDPENSTLTVTTDETGRYAVPQIVFGVPVRLKRITVNIDRPGFMFNPTSCAAQQIAASISGSQEAVAHVASPFAAGGCKSLAFKPRFSVSTNGRTSRALGASLDAKLSYPPGAMGNDANIAQVKVSLPRQLPSYLPTLKKACLAATFDANPAACPTGSIVGIAKARTPLLPVGLSGPAYFVSHGGAEFPSLIVVLQGDGVRVDLIGSTFIEKGITSSTFKTVPDVPVNTFELYLPQGQNHALAANGNLCSTATTVTVNRKVTRRVHGRTEHRTIAMRVAGPGLLMPTEFVAQNGMVLKQSTRITVTGCAKSNAKSAQRAHKSTSRGGRGR